MKTFHPNENRIKTEGRGDPHILSWDRAQKQKTFSHRNNTRNKYNSRKTK